MTEPPRMGANPEHERNERATGGRTPPLPDFRAIDAATANEVVSDQKSLKEEEDLFKKAIRVEMQRLVVWALRVGAGILLVLLVVRFLHLILPMPCRWLTEVDIQAIDKMLFSSAFGGFVLTYLKEALGTKK